MKSIIRKFLSLSLAVVLAAAPLNAFASDALGDDLASSSVEVNERTELNAGTFWSNTYSDLRQENYVVYSPNARVKPIVSGGDYTTQLTTVSTAAKKLEARGYRVVAGINGDYYDTATGIPLGSMMTEGVLRNASSRVLRHRLPRRRQHGDGQALAPHHGAVGLWPQPDGHGFQLRTPELVRHLSL